jgi:hypothetical protein
MPATFTILPELQSLIPRLTPEEFAQLEANLLAEGCRDALVVWQEEQVLLDGHNRYDISERHALTYGVHEVSLPDLDAAKIWIIRNQRGRRNLTPEQQSYLRGTEYHLTKGVRGGDRKSKGNFYPLIDTASQLAAEHKVSERTIKNDAAFSRDIDTLAAAVGGDDVNATRHALLARETHVDRHGVRTLAKIATHTNPQTAKYILKEMNAAPTPKAAKEVLRAAVRSERELFALWGESGYDEAVGEDTATTAVNGTVSTESPAPAIFTEVLEPEDDEKPHRNRYGVVTDQSQVVNARFGTTSSPEWYTPSEIIEPARLALGGIDLDPASCPAANAVVQATRFYSIDDDGLSLPWKPRIFGNFPFNDIVLSRFIGKLFDELRWGRTTDAIILTNNCTETHWWRALATTCQRLCFLCVRVQFWRPDGQHTNPPQGQTLFYYGLHPERFDEAFAEISMLSPPLVAPRSAQLELLEAFPTLPVPAPTPAPEEPDTAPAPEEPEPRPLPVVKGTIATRIVAVLDEEPDGMVNFAIARAVGTNRKRSFQALERLVQQGIVYKDGLYYHLVYEQENATDDLGHD